MLASDLSDLASAEVVMWHTWDEPLTDPRFVLARAVMRRTFYGSAIRGFAEAAAAVAGRHMTRRASIVSARSVLECAAEMHWLYRPDLDPVDRLNRTLTFYLAEEHEDDRLLGSFGAARESHSRGLTAEACRNAGIEVQRGRRGAYVGTEKPSNSTLVAQVMESAGVSAKIALYQQLSRLAHAGDYLTESGSLRGSNPDEWTNDTMGHLTAGLPTSLMELVGRGLTEAARSAALYLGQDWLPTLATYAALRVAAGLDEAQR